MGILRSDRVSGLGGANAINGSVYFAGAQNLRTSNTADLRFGSSDLTLECWWYTGDLSADVNFVSLWNSSSNRRSWGVYYDADSNIFGLNGSTDGTNSDLTVVPSWTPSRNTWYHLACVKIGTAITIYVDGTSTGNGTKSGSYYENTVDPIVIGGQMAGTSYDSKMLRGYMSNLRIIKGEGIYTANFTPPTTRLEKTANTVLLCCQSPGDITQEATGKVLVPYRKTTNDEFPKASRFAPDVGEDYGTTFEDNTKFDTLSYMVPPGGTTAERGRGRGLIAGGCTPLIAEIDYIQIQSQGNSTDFGSLSATRFGHNGCASATRGLFGGGAEPTIRNIIEYVTIATTSNVTDFGDLTVARRDVGSLSNQTRGIWAGGSTPTIKDEIDYVTIASTGNAADFGNLTAATIATSGCCASSTRGLIGGGGTPSAVNTIEYITIASTGNAADFGDLTRTAFSLSCVSNSTRGVWANGGTNTIDYVTIASTGNAADFGDTTLVRAQCTASLSNSIRGVFAGGYQPSPTSADTNVIDFIEIASIGNAMDFGDINRVGDTGNRENGGCSDSHGGIS